MAAAQGVVAPEPSSTANEIQEAGVPPIEDNLGTTFGRSSSDSPFEWGPYILKPSYLYRFVYGDGIQSSPGHPLVTAIDTFSPGFELDDAALWTINYAPTWNLYSNHAFHDTLDESASVSAKKILTDWTLQFAQAYSYTSDPLIETGSQTSEQDFTTTFDAAHALSRRVLADINFSQDLQFTYGFVDTYTWTNQDWLHYRISTRVDTAIGMGIGYVDVSRGSDSAYARPQLQSSWSPTEKISFSATAGLEHREYYGLASATLNTPIYNASLLYSPAKTTSLNLSAGRQVSQSFFANESNRSTQWTAGVDQRLLTHFRLSASVTYATTDYLASNDKLALSRSDDMLSYTFRLSTTLLRRGTIAIFFQKSHDLSTVEAFQYSSNQAGLELSYRY